MDINYLLVTFIAILIICIIRGARKGMLRIVYGIIAWIFLICFVNYASAIVASYLSVSTDIPAVIQENISTHLTDRYNESEEKEEGTGEEAVMVLVPATIKAEIEETVQESIQSTIKLISEELTEAAINGISTIVSVIAGIIIIFIVGKIIAAIGLVPGLRDVNRLLGIIAGFMEGMLITWLLMYIASCFPASGLGSFVIENAQKDQLLYYIYQNNIIAGIIGI